MLADVLGLRFMVHGAHGFTVHHMVKGSWHGVVCLRNNSAEHGTMQQESHKASRTTGQLAERNVFLVLLSDRQHVALRRSVSVIILFRGSCHLVILTAYWQLTCRTRGCFHRATTLANEESV